MEKVVNSEMKYLRLFSVLNIDAALGACSVSFLISRFLELQQPWFAYVLLFLAVFGIYLADHWFDQLKIKSESVSERRLFYRNNAKPLQILLAIVVVSGLILAVFILPDVILIRAGVLSLACILYLSINYISKSTLLPKEFVIAILYTVGVAFYPLSIFGNHPYNHSHFLVLAIIGLIALENLVVYSIIDHNEDTQCGFYSISTKLGVKKAMLFCQICFMINFILLIFLLIFYPEKWVYTLILVLIHGVQFFVYKQRAVLNNFMLYRLYADGVFILPIILIFT